MSDVLDHLARVLETIKARNDPVDLKGGRPASSSFAQDIEELDNFLHKKTRPVSLSDLPAFIDAAKRINTGLDDRKLLLEKVLVLMSRLPAESEVSAKLQQFVIDLLYKDLPHPPASYLRLPSSAPKVLNETTLGSSDPKKIPYIKYAFRNADGSEYNPLFPTLGKAGSPYARSVASSNVTPARTLPDAGLVFDTLLKREKFTPHPGGISSLFFAFADLVIHSCFNTNTANDDYTTNNASSYLDLSILYGSSDAEVNRVRKKDGSGKIWEDVFADSRLLLMPPSACALLVLLSRNHNYIAEKIMNINEHSAFDPESKSMIQDDEIFHRTRLVNCGYFMQIILGDYVGAILGLVRDGSVWRLDPLQTMRQLDHEFSPQGQGNVVSIEFNLLYRWHATLSEQDAKWTEQEFGKLFGGRDFSTITPTDFKKIIGTKLRPDPDPRKWTFGSLTRGADGRFDDNDLAKILQDATEWSAAAFGARGTPEVLRVIEMLGIEQSRSWGTCSLNEFRKFMGLRPYENFQEWNPRKEIYTAAEALYKTIDNLELHVGLQAEEAKTPGPGAGLCPGYTISRAILADAVCLTRGDRFLTVDFTPFNLTSWGYQDCQYNKEDGSFGGMLTKLLFRTLPNQYPAGSAYAHFPFLVPSEEFQAHMAGLPNNNVKKYIWTRPPVPKGSVTVESYELVKEVVSQPSKYLSAYASRLSSLTKSLVPDQKDETLIFVQGVLSKHDWSSAFLRYTRELIKKKSVDHIGGTSHKYVDIVKDVVNLLPVYWVSKDIVGMPFKTEKDPKAVWREQELYGMFADVCRYVYLNFDPVNDWTLRERSLTTFKHATQSVLTHLPGNKFASLLHSAQNIPEFLAQLVEFGKGIEPEHLANSVVAEVVPTAAHWSQAVAHIVNFYLGEERKQEREDIVRLATKGSPDDLNRVMLYCHEALRLDPIVSGVYRTAGQAVKFGSTSVQVGERIFASLTKANLDPSVFGPEPAAFVFDRPASRSGIYGIGEHGLLSHKSFESTVPHVVGAILGLKNIQRGPGTSGEFNSFTEYWHDTPQKHYIGSKGEVIPWPDSLVIQYDV